MRRTETHTVGTGVALDSANMANTDDVRITWTTNGAEQRRAVIRLSRRIDEVIEKIDEAAENLLETETRDPVVLYELRARYDYFVKQKRHYQKQLRKLDGQI